MKKIICIALSAILLTACHAEEKEQQVTGMVETTATTPLTLTEIITEEIPFIPEEEEKQEVIELAVFNPFEDSVKVEDEVYRELIQCTEAAYDNLDTIFDMQVQRPKETYITDYSENSFKSVVVVYGEYPFNSFHFDFVMSNDEWIVEKWDVQTYFIKEYSMLYDIFVFKRDKWNSILSGRVDKNAPSVIIGDEEYKPADTGMTLDEMREFFDANLGETVREDYKQKYIEEVYGVLDGRLYRKVSAPEWYMPEAKLDVFNIGMIRSGAASKQSYHYYADIRLDFSDAISEKSFDSEIKLVTLGLRNSWEYDEENNTCIFPYYQKYVDSELPIMEVTK